MHRAPFGLLLAASALAAQTPPLVLPQASPRAQVAQTVGLTDITVTYARPSVHGRKVWGGLVPYGQVWRAGANENTTVTFSTPVKAGGVALPAGTYGLHMLPTAAAWTVIFSNESHAWGSFSYDPREDAARFTVTPVAAEALDRLEYAFDEVTDGAATLSLRWEKLRVPLRIEVDTNQVVVASLREQLRGLPRFSAEGWAGAAGWCVRHDVNLEEAQAWVDRSLEMKETFGALRTKALLADKRGDAAGAAALRTRAMAVATEAEVNNLGYALLGQGKVDEALDLFRRNVKDHADSWNAYDSLAEGLAAKGDKAGALKNYQQALGMVRAEDQRARIRTELAKLQ
ncbi:DUF2911 domain-containing protein [Mesoterricola silvestris]|uniref:DUF2911 domain-containing protein n=1 Tax=Mesoterricola silvestris TaxID=2927979 RepID=A0AA48GNM8_9BACT|nr:DUF2911 domain-containing protein [Mesoterricola silvestris]BDU73214.1 hypothetical protein METEAL_23880 [Mesoterricola silvestris]